MPSAHVERELKVRLPADAAPDVVASLVADVRRGGASKGEAPDGEHASTEAVASVEATDAVELVAVYHDTLDLRLARWGVTLRRREGGGDAGWHLKLPQPHDETADGVAERLELGAPLSAGEVGDPPAELHDLVAALVRDAPVRPLAQVRTLRRTWVVRDAAGAALVEVSDDAVQTARLGLDEAEEAAQPEGSETTDAQDGPGGGIEFREVEVEAATGTDGRPVEGSDAVVAALSAALEAVGATPSPSGKGVEALGAAALGPADVVVPADQHGDDVDGSAREALRAVLASQTQALLWADVAVRLGEPDGVHDFRVAARTLRSALRTFAPLLEEDWRDALRSELSWVAGAFGEARDAEVQRELLQHDAERLGSDDAEAAAGVVDRLLTQRYETAHAAALAQLRTRRYLELLEALVAAAREPLTTAVATHDVARGLRPLVTDAGRRLRGKADTLDLAVDAERWHRVRIHAKRARYAADALAATGSKRARRLAKALKKVTTVLGDVHDAAVSQEVLRDLAAEPDVTSEEGLALGLLIAAERDKERELQEAFLEIWPTVRKELRRFDD